LQRLTLAVDYCVLGYNAVLRRIDFDDLELYLSHATAYCEKIALAYWSVGLTEVWGKEDVEKGTGDALPGIGDRKDGNALGLESWLEGFRGKKT
jgi:hypothetical protein